MNPIRAAKPIAAASSFDQGWRKFFSSDISFDATEPVTCVASYVRSTSPGNQPLATGKEHPGKTRWRKRLPSGPLLFLPAQNISVYTISLGNVSDSHDMERASKSYRKRDLRLPRVGQMLALLLIAAG